MSANVGYLAADLASRIPAMAQDSNLNATNLIMNLVERVVQEEVEIRLKATPGLLMRVLDDLTDAASGYAPYPWNHEENPYCKTIMQVRAALGLPIVPVTKDTI